MLVAPEIHSAKPYLIRALYEWCVDQGQTPFICVFVDASVRVPQNFVRDDAITLNIGGDATCGLIINNEAIEFKARFGGVAHQIVVPITHVMAIYAAQSGEGMAFPLSREDEVSDQNDQKPHVLEPKAEPSSTAPTTVTKPRFTIVR